MTRLPALVLLPWIALGCASDLEQDSPLSDAEASKADSSDEPEPTPVGLDECDEDVLDLSEECLADLDRQGFHPVDSMEVCTSEDSLVDVFGMLCEDGSLGPPRPFCQHGLDAYVETMLPACQQRLRDGPAPIQSDIELTFLPLSDELEELQDVLTEECDGRCTVEMEAWTYEAEMPTLSELADALRSRMAFGTEYSFLGETNSDLLGTEFPAAADAFAASSNPSVGLLTRFSVPAPNVDALHDRIFLVYSATNTIVSLEETRFLD